jgi:hypothetical protein
MKHNDAIIQRIKGIPAQRGSFKERFDPRNPNQLHANDNAARPVETIEGAE